MDTEKVGSDEAPWPLMANGEGEAFGLLIARYRHRVRGQCVVKSESLGAVSRSGNLISSFKMLTSQLRFPCERNMR